MDDALKRLQKQLKWTNEEHTIQIGATLFIASGVAGSIAWASQDGFNFVGVASATLAVGAAALLVGCLIGFIFGIPRLDSETHADGTVAGNKASAADAKDKRVGYRANTNLEQVSDWLAKILVGVGLTQISEVPQAAARLGAVLKPILGDTQQSAGFGVAWTLFAAIGGFFVTYLWTRLELGKALREADSHAVASALADLRSSLVQQTEHSH